MNYYNIQYFPAGSTIFREGNEGNTAFVIKKGKVEISKVFGSKRVILDLFSQGSIFGEMALLVDTTRTATATAVEDSELIVISKRQLDDVLNEAPSLTKTLIVSLVERLKNTSKKVNILNSDNIFYSICHILAILFENSENEDHSVSFQTIRATIKNILTITEMELRSIIDKLVALNLIEKIKGPKSQITLRLLDQENFITKVRRFLKEFSSSMPNYQNQITEMLDLVDIAKLVEVEEDKILAKIASGEFPKEICLFPRTAFTKWIEEVGKDSFDKKFRRRKKVEDFCELADIMYVDNNTLRQVLGTIDVYKLSRLMKDAEDEIAKKIKNCLSTKVKATLEEEIKYVEEVDPLEFEDYEDELINMIKAIKLQKTPPIQE